MVSVVDKEPPLTDNNIRGPAVGNQPRMPRCFAAVEE